MNAVQMEAYNPNYVGGDINGGLADLAQLFTRPTITPNIADPYATPAKGLYICSSSTPPGGGVHGLCGYYAAQAALRTIFGRRETPQRHQEVAGTHESAGPGDVEQEAMREHDADEMREGLAP
jgi:hypothetical protein